MELRCLAKRVVLSGVLEDKLDEPTTTLTDDAPGASLRVTAPARPPGLEPAPARSVKVPPITGMRDRSQRARILVALANHELQAVELFGWALLAFPDTPPAFRRGLAATLIDEQRHCRLYIERARAHGLEFAEQPVTGHFWNKLPDIETPLQFVCTMGLTFENANLDFALEYATAARAAGDEETAQVLDLVHVEEIRHVAFAWQWLQKFGGDQDPWQTYLANVKWPLGPDRARGKQFCRDSRVAAGMDEAFIRELERACPRRPNGAKR